MSYTAYKKYTVYFERSEIIVFTVKMPRWQKSKYVFLLFFSKFEIKKKRPLQRKYLVVFYASEQDVNRKQPSNVYTVYLGRRRLTLRPLSSDEIRLSICKHFSP